MVLSILLFYARSLPGHGTDAQFRRCGGPDGQHPGRMMKRSIAGSRGGMARRWAEQSRFTTTIPDEGRDEAVV